MPRYNFGISSDLDLDKSCLKRPKNAIFSFETVYYCCIKLWLLHYNILSTAGCQRCSVNQDMDEKWPRRPERLRLEGGHLVGGRDRVAAPPPGIRDRPGEALGQTRGD